MSRPWQIEWHELRAPVSGMAGAARGQAERASLILSLRDNNGRCGRGEASPLPDYSPDSLEQCAAEFAAIDLSRLSPLAADENVIDWAQASLDASGLSAPAARFALETALLDWAGQARQAPVWRLLAPELETPHPVPLSALVSDLAGARQAWARGIRTFKLKLDAQAPQAAIALGQALRAEFVEAALRFDANGQLAPDQVNEVLQALAPLHPEFIEEPVAGAMLARLPAQPVAIAADESLTDPAQRQALIDRCQALVLKPTVLGGVLACRHIALAAQARGKTVCLTHCFDGPMAQQATAQLAAVVPEVAACGLGRHAAQALWPGHWWPAWDEAQIRLGQAPGLGLARA